jgi:carboxypeptidase Q
MPRIQCLPLLLLLLLASPAAAPAQTFAVEDPVLRRIWSEGMENSQAPRLAQTLLDSIGPRLTGSPAQLAAQEWAVAMYRSWGIAARNEQYGTWRGWRRGTSHIDLIAPRVRSLEGRMLAWSPGTQGPVEGDVTVLGEFGSEEAFRTWLPEVRGRFVLISFPQPSCRPDENWEEFALDSTNQRHREQRTEAREAWDARLRAAGGARDLPRRLEEAGAIGIISSNWSGGWGANRIFQARTERIATFDLSCEDYGLVHRLAANEQSPRLRVQADAEFLGEVPVFNTIAEIRGVERPNEYVLLSAHFDSWDGASGATDNGTGTVTMMEAMRILRTAYPRPKRTILVGHWSGEEQGLNGSRAFVADNPRIVRGMQALFNQDNGTGRISQISMQGFTGAGGHFGRWLARIPEEISRHITLQLPGTPSSGGTDHAAFVCAGAPAFNLGALHWSYFTYTWHTNLDTYDKVVMDDLRNNATLTAMLAYLAAEDSQAMPRERRQLAAGWPECQPPARSSVESAR